MEIKVESCRKCPFNYDTNECTAADGNTNYTKGPRTVRPTERGFPHDCPLIKGAVIVKAGKEENKQEADVICQDYRCHNKCNGASFVLLGTTWNVCLECQKHIENVIVDMLSGQ